ncbi:MAG: hypothetical protein AVDCRST_MAG45-1929 [uncultured Solirubrobacterales bacterium]|uniref:DUF1648 domain-containing protein n=1 Tax=uncultured Solirubrobacterales bacterium TaxID=768556 RepID=A0A6J4T274_9ACTN|nr:MAG: hypothetical protein AVDCRST_MAG45-1929 [uncultured Solirubrobacterales bacterium]
MEFKVARLDSTEWWGMAGSLLLAISTLLPWFTTDPENPNSKIQGARGAANAWESFDVLQYFLLLCCLAPFVLAWIVVRGHQVGWNRGEVTAIFGALALTAVLLNGIILGQPGTVEIYPTWGYPVAIFASVVILVTGAMRGAKGRKKQPPGV